jgi:hypothetical protein
VQRNQNASRHTETKMRILEIIHLAALVLVNSASTPAQAHYWSRVKGGNSKLLGGNGRVGVLLMGAEPANGLGNC